MAGFSPGALDALRTERLTLARPREADRADLLVMHQDPGVMATLGGVRTPVESSAAFDRQCAHWDAHAFGYWIVRDPEGERFAGRAGLSLMVVDGEPEVEVGYGLMSDYWDRGLATELATASVRAAFEVLGVRSLVCFTMTSNRKSQRVMEKVGFRYEQDFVHADLAHRLCRLDASSWGGAG